MVTVDDATYVKMKDTLYGGDAGAASKAKAQIESSYTQQQYDNLVSKLGGMGTTQQTTTPKPSNMDAGSSNIQQTTTPSRNMQTETPTRQQETAGSTVSNIQQQGELKPLSQEYYNQTSSNALDVIKNNLNSYKQSNPEYFNNYEDYKKNFSYNSRNQEQKDVLDNFYNQYQKGLTLSSTPVNDLYTQYKDGQISLADLELLKGNNPAKYAELQNQINKASILTAYDDTTPTEKMNFQDIAYQMIANSLNMINSGDYGASKYFSQLEEKMNSPEMMELQDKTTEINEAYKNIEDQIAGIAKDVEKEYEGTGATKSKINAIIADRTYDLQQQLRTLGNEYNKYATQYNNRATQYQNEFQLQLQEYQVNMQARKQQIDELGFAIDLMNFETNEQKQQREWDYWVKQQEYTNGNINSKDYDTRYKAALKSVQNLLSQYEGIPMQRSAEQMAQDILKAIDGGSDLGAELTKINQQIQGKPEYKMLYNQTFQNPDAGFSESFTVGDTQYVKYNGQRYTADELNNRMGNGAIGNPKPYDVVSEEMFSIDPSKGGLGAFLMDSKNANGKKGGQCAKFVNDYLQQIGVGRYFGNEDIKTRQQWANSNTPKVGSIAIFDYGHTSSDGINHGHVAIVTQVNKDGSFKVKESNYPSGETIGTRTVNPNSPSLKGFFDPSQGARSVSENPNTITPTTTVGNLTNTQFDSYVKQFIDGNVNYSEVKATYGDDGLAKVRERAEQLKEGGYTPSTKITDPTKMSNMEIKYKSEYDKAVSDAQETIDWVNKMDEAYDLVDTDLNAASQALVIAYNKILDSGSVVREGEYARTAEGQSALKQITSKLQKLAKGGAGISKSELQSLVNVAHKFSESAKKTQERAAQTAKVSIDKYGLTPEAVLPLEVVNQLYGTTQTTKQSTSQSTKKVSGLNVLKSSLSNLNKNILQSAPNTKATLQSKYGINN